jgi:hypothetical protein
VVSFYVHSVDRFDALDNLLELLLKLLQISAPLLPVYESPLVSPRSHPEDRTQEHQNKIILDEWKFPFELFLSVKLVQEDSYLRLKTD